jgi:peptide/nickel transport system permease protein
MLRYITRRVLFGIMVMFCVLTFVFFLMYVIPADPAQQVAGPRASQESIENIRRNLGLDQPVYVQYFKYLWNLLQGDMGRSWMYRRPVVQAVFGRFPASIKLGLAAALTELFLGAVIGTLSAIYRYTWVDRVSMVLVLIGLSLPSFWFGLVLLYLLGFVLPIFPLGGYGGLKYMVLPALAVGVPYSGWYARMLRSGMREVMAEDYVRTARAKGLRESRVIFRHAMRNALIPVITMWGMDLGSFVGGLALVEVIFGWPGVGWQAVEAAKNLDVPLVMGSVILVSGLMVTANLAVDIVYGVLDPRVVYN